VAKRVIPPIVDFVDPRRVPYDIMEDPRYNGKGPTPDWLARLMIKNGYTRVKSDKWMAYDHRIVFKTIIF